MKQARSAAESDAAEARRQRDAAEKCIETERNSREEAELHASELGVLVGKLQRQRDAAEAIAAQLETLTAPPLPARGSDDTTMNNASMGHAGSPESSVTPQAMAGETIAQLQDALKESNRRVFELAGIEEKMEELQRTHNATLRTLNELEDSENMMKQNLDRLRQQCTTLRSQRDAAEKDADMAKQTRIQTEAALQDLKTSYENLLEAQEEPQGSELLMDSKSGDVEDAANEQKMHNLNTEAADAIEAKWKDIVESSADEVFLLMSSMRAHIEKIENMESVMAGFGAGQKVGPPVASMSIEDMVEEDDDLSDS